MFSCCWLVIFAHNLNDMETLRKTREKLGLTQQDVRDLCGIRQEALSRIETGCVLPKANIRDRIETSLDCRINWLQTFGIPEHKTKGKKLKPAVIEHRLIK